MNPSLQLVSFTLDGHLFALELAEVQRVIRATEVTLLPQAPAVIMGVVNIHGELFSVVNLRQRFRLPARTLHPSDQFILVNLPTATPTSAIRLALVVDSVAGIHEIAAYNVIDKEEVVAGLEGVRGVAKVADGLVLIHDLARCLSLHEQAMLGDALVKLGDA